MGPDQQGRIRGALDRRVQLWAQGRGVLPVIVGFPEIDRLTAHPRGPHRRRIGGDRTPAPENDAVTRGTGSTVSPGTGAAETPQQGRTGPSGVSIAQTQPSLRGGTARATPVAPVPRVPLGGYRSLGPHLIQEMGLEVVAKRYEDLSHEIEQSERLMGEMVRTRERAEEDRRRLGWRKDMMQVRDFMEQQQGFAAERKEMKLSLRQQQLQLAQDVGRALAAIQARKGTQTSGGENRPEEDSEGSGVELDGVSQTSRPEETTRD